MPRWEQQDAKHAAKQDALTVYGRDEVSVNRFLGFYKKKLSIKFNFDRGRQ
jgi:hypothetical protein